MIQILNFFYKGFAFAKPRFGALETFWVLVFSLILSPIDSIILYFSLINSNEDFVIFYLIITMFIRSVPLFIIKPFTNKRFSSLYVVDRNYKYWLNAIIAFFLFLIFMGFPGWLLAVFTSIF